LKVIVTGSSGFIGKNLVEKLGSKDYEVATYDIREYPNLDVCYMPRLKDFMKDCEIIFHLANMPAHRLSVENPHKIIYNNFIGTLNVAEAARQTDCEKIVFMSSFAVYGDQNYLPWHEGLDLEPTTPYGLCKMQCEQLLEMYLEIYDIDLIIIRPSNVFGKYEELHLPCQVLPLWFDFAKQDKSLIVNGGDTTRDFTWVDDVVEGTIKASEKFCFNIFNFCSGEEIKLVDIARYISNKVEIKPLPKWEQERWVGYNQKAKKELGWEPTKTIWEWIDERRREFGSEKVNA
jgi:UDP-glucose 4-epimerase